MAQNENKTDSDFMDVLFKNVELVFPRLDQTYKFNSTEQKSEACAQTVNGAAWSVGVKISKAEAKPIYMALKEHYEKCHKRNEKLQPFSQVFGMKKLEEEGAVIFEGKKKGTTEAGKSNHPPTVIDGQKQPIPKDQLNIWSGSRGTVRFRAFPTTSPATKEHPKGLGGISLLLDVVQLTKRVYGGANLDDFDMVEDEPIDHKAAPADDDFDQSSQKPAPAAKKPPADDAEF
jgi:hypothetical protein